MKSKFEELWDSYDNRRKEFCESHKEQRCCCCLETIRPGESIWCEPLTDHIYCSAECYANAHDGVYLDFEEDGYESWFDTKEEINNG
jgi:hypothetical protein